MSDLAEVVEAVEVVKPSGSPIIFGEHRFSGAKKIKLMKKSKIWLKKDADAKNC